METFEIHSESVTIHGVHKLGELGGIVEAPQTGHFKSLGYPMFLQARSKGIFCGYLQEISGVFLTPPLMHVRLAAPGRSDLEMRLIRPGRRSLETAKSLSLNTLVRLSKQRLFVLVLEEECFMAACYSLAATVSRPFLVMLGCNGSPQRQRQQSGNRTNLS